MISRFPMPWWFRYGRGDFAFIPERCPNPFAVTPVPSPPQGPLRASKCDCSQRFTPELGSTDRRLREPG
jgi:hypothetical protein